MKKVILSIIENLIINDPFNYPKELYKSKKETFISNGTGIYLSQFLDAQIHFPMSLLQTIKNTENKKLDFIDDFSFTIIDKNGKQVISINVELTRTGFIKVNYGLLNYINSYLVTSNTNGSAKTISIGYRYTEFFPKFLGDFLQGVESIINNKIYASGDKASFFTLLLLQNFNGIYQSRIREDLIYFDISTIYSTKRKINNNR